MVRFERGQLQFVRRGAAPIGIHWSLPLGLAILSRFTFEPWFVLSYVGLILAHELGHAVLVKGFRFHVEGIVLHGLGGECSYSGPVTQQKRSIIAWGGVAAQTLILALVLALGLAIPPEGSWDALYTALTRTNALLIALNLVPLPGFDGYHAWRLIFGSRRKTPPPPRRQAPPPRPRQVGGDNVLRFPTERVRTGPSEDPGEALRDVNAQILEIAERVNNDKKKRPSGD